MAKKRTYNDPLLQSKYDSGYQATINRIEEDRRSKERQRAYDDGMWDALPLQGKILTYLPGVVAFLIAMSIIYALSLSLYPY